MKYWMYAGGHTPGSAWAEMKAKGITGVIGPAAIAEPALAAGLEVMLCGGAFPAGKISEKGDEHLAVDINGKKQLWFYSCCPSHRPTREANLEMYRRMAKTPGISGVIIDGARFASPSSSFDPDAFFTCFCPRCKEAMKDFGINPDRTEKAVRELYDWCMGSGKTPSGPVGIENWFAFRRKQAGSHLRDFADVVHKAGLKAGAFLFFPSISDMVGQSYEDMSSVMDIVSPMLYSAYPVTETDYAAACLNSELAAIYRLLTAHGALTEREAMKKLEELTGTSLPAPDEMAKAVPSALVGSETAKVSAKCRPALNMPILQLDEPNLHESIRLAVEAGADEIAFFLYKEEVFSGLPALPEF